MTLNLQILLHRMDNLLLGGIVSVVMISEGQ